MKLAYLHNYIQLSKSFSIRKVFEEKDYNINDEIIYIPKSSITHIRANLDNMSKDPEAAGIRYDVTIYYGQAKEVTLQINLEELKKLEDFLS